MNDLFAGLPFGNAGTAAASTSPETASFVQRTPASATGGATPFDLNAFLDTQIDSSTIPNEREAPPPNL